MQEGVETLGVGEDAQVPAVVSVHVERGAEERAGGGDEVRRADDATTGNLDGAEVTVSIVRQTRPDVLSVPVDALLALREGGYALEVVDADGGSHLVAVEVGLFDDDGVEVRGDIDVGDSVVVPA